MNTENILKIIDIKKRYNSNTDYTLPGMNLDIRAGEFFGLLGPNGCGKTTLISIVTGLLQPTSGNVEINGLNLRKHFNKVKYLIGIVPQDLALFPTLTLTENLTFFCHMYGISGKKMRERIEFCIKIARLESFKQKPIGSYSGGMKRRANLVLGLIHSPKILFLDEITVNVDPQSRQVIFDILQELNNNGMTMIYTTHYMEEADKLCSRVAIMDNGEIIRNDIPSNLIKSVPDARNLEDVFLGLTGKHLRD